MAIRKIHEVGDPCLAKVCRPVTEFNDRLHELLDDMADTLEEAIREAYRISDGVQFTNAYRRSDIGQRALQALK